MSDEIRFLCPTCKAVMSAPIAKGGEKINCLQCGQRLQIPSGERAKTIMAPGLCVNDESNPAPHELAQEPPPLPPPLPATPASTPPPLSSPAVPPPCAPKSTTVFHDIVAAIPFRNGMALAAYYCGVFGLIGCFLFGVGGLFGIVPVILGILGLQKANADPEARGRGHAWVGILLGMLELLTGCGAVGYIIFAGVADKRAEKPAKGGVNVAASPPLSKADELRANDKRDSKLAHFRRARSTRSRSRRATPIKSISGVATSTPTSAWKIPSARRSPATTIAAAT